MSESTSDSNRMLNHVPAWSALARIGESKVVRSSYLWFLLVPIAAKVLASTNRTLDLQLLGTNLTLTLDLPFSWTLFFFASLFFALGTALYTLRVPTFISLFPTGAEFLAGERETHDLFSHARQVLSLMAGPTPLHEPLSAGDLCKLSLEQRQLIEDICECSKSESRYTSHLSWQKICRFDDIDQRAAFWVVHRHADQVRVRSRLAVTLFYLIGGVFFGIVTIFNVAFAISFLAR